MAAASINPAIALADVNFFALLVLHNFISYSI
jgi:hypothetical protein